MFKQITSRICLYEFHANTYDLHTYIYKYIYLRMNIENAAWRIYRAGFLRATCQANWKAATTTSLLESRKAYIQQNIWCAFVRITHTGAHTHTHTCTHFKSWAIRGQKQSDEKHTKFPKLALPLFSSMPNTTYVFQLYSIWLDVRIYIYLN